MQKSFFSRFLVFLKHWFFVSVFAFIINYNDSIAWVLSSWTLDLPLWQMAVDASSAILLFTLFLVVLLIPPAVPSRPKVHRALSRISVFTASAFFILFTLNALTLWFQKISGAQFTVGLLAKIIAALAVLSAVGELMRLKSCESLRVLIDQGMDRLVKVSVGLVATCLVFFLLSFSSFVLFSGDKQPSVHTSFAPRGAVHNILLVTFDALAAQDMSLYGYRLDTTPNINKFAQSCAVFDNFYAQGNWTFPTVTSLLTGTYPSEHRNYTIPYRYPRLSQPQNVLQAVLKEHGFYTAAASSNVFYGNTETTGTYFGFDAIAEKKHLVDWAAMRRDMPFYALATYGQSAYTQILMTLYHSFETFLSQYYEERDNFLPIGPALTYAERFMTARPFFVWIHLYPPHHPYLPPAPHRGLYCKGDCCATDSQKEPRLGTFYTPDKQNYFDQRRLRYDEFIHYADDEFGGLIDRLKRKGLLEDTMVILAADHGESFEDLFFGHGNFILWNQIIRVPCVIHMPGVQAARLSVNAEQIDLAPTILDTLGIEKPGWMQGESLLPYMLGQKDRTDKPKYSMSLMGNGRFDKKLSKGLVAVMLGPLKLIYNVEIDKAQLYDLVQDPKEDHDISEAKPEEVKHLKALIKKDILHRDSPPA